MAIWIFVYASICLLFASCNSSTDERPHAPAITKTATAFSYPVGKRSAVTEARDASDGWYNAQDFEENDHLGEDWNGNGGGNSDCEEPVFSAGDGVVVMAANAGPGWGNVVIVEHLLPDGSRIQSLYGHLSSIKVTSGTVEKGELIGKIGDGNGRYLCHLHFEIRDQTSRSWGKPGPGYSSDRTGWTDPSDFIDSRIPSP